VSGHVTGVVTGEGVFVFCSGFCLDLFQGDCCVGEPLPFPSLVVCFLGSLCFCVGLVCVFVV
jgi:hypothetical protein